MWVAAALLVSVAFSGPGSDDIQRAARKVVSDSDYQSKHQLRKPRSEGGNDVRLDEDWDDLQNWERRGGGAPAPEDDGGVVDRTDRDDLGERRRNRRGIDRTARRRPRDIPRRDEPEIDSSSGSMDLSGVFTVLGWTVVGVIAVLAVVWLVNALTGYNQNVKAKKDADPPVPDTEKTAALVRPKSEAELLAEAGKFGEAIHVLLLLTLAELARNQKGVLRDSMTSREIVAGVPVPESARPSLAGLVQAVERSLFGGVEPARADFEVCLDHFNTFAAAYAEGAA